jgi:hypothetical protein
MSIYLVLCMTRKGTDTTNSSGVGSQRLIIASKMYAGEGEGS